MKALRRGLKRLTTRLAKSMAHSPDPRPGDLQRWRELRAEIVVFEKTLALVLAGENPPLAASTGARARELPDRIGED